MLTVSPTVARAQGYYQVQIGGGIGLVATCTDSSGQTVYDCSVSMWSGYYPYTGGHAHDDSTHNQLDGQGKPMFYGKLDLTSGNTGTSGLPFQFLASWTGESEYVSVCADTCSWTDIDVTQYQLVWLSDSPYHTLVGDTTIHRQIIGYTARIMLT
jgi:hypothetical protein